jgi:hypothetical protein
LRNLPWMIVDVSAGDAEQAGTFKGKFNIPYAHAFAGALTLAHSAGPKAQHATLLTADYDFKTLAAGTIKIEFLPQK